MPTYTLNDVITNRIDKKVNYGKARTNFDHEKGPNNEAIPSPSPSPSHTLWINSHLITAVAPATNDSTVDVYQYNSNASNTTPSPDIGKVQGVMELTRDPTVTSHRSWITCSTIDIANTRLDNWVRTTYGATYISKFAIAPSGNGNGNIDLSGLTGYREIYPQTTGEEYYFDYESGVFVFIGNINGSLSGGPADLLAKTGNVYDYSVYMIKGWRYTSTIGLQNYSFGQLGADLDVNGFSIISVTNGDITLAPNGTGKTKLGGIIHVTSEQSSSPAAPIDTAGGYLYTKPDGKPYWVSYDQLEVDLSAGSGPGGVTLGIPTDTTFNDGAYYQALTAYQSGNVLSGISTSGSVADALDGVNETIKNIHNNTYVQGAYFTRSPIEGSASPAAPLVVTFTIIDPGDATHMDLEFDNTTQSTSYTSVINDTTWKDAGGSGVHYYDYSFTDVLGGSVDVTMTLKCQLASGTTGLTEGSYFKYKFTTAVQLWEPDPEVSWIADNNDQIVDLGGSGGARRITFDASNTLYAHYWMIDYGDGTIYPPAANPTDTSNASIASTWISVSSGWSAPGTQYHYDSPPGTITQDTRWSPIIYARSVTARGNAGWTNSLERVDYIEGYITPIASFTADNFTTGNNDEIGDINAQGTINTAVGHPVKFTNTTQNLGEWGATTYTWDWDDGLGWTVIVDNGQTEAGLPGDQIEHYFTLQDDDIAQTFDVTLKAENNRENQNNDTSTITITVNVDPRASFSGELLNQNTSTPTQSYVDPRIGYNFTKYDPINGGADSNGASNIVDFTNSSGGITGTSPTYAWTFNNGQTSTLSDPPDQTFTTVQSYDVELITQNTNSYAGGTDDTELKSNYITINVNPAAPSGLTGLTLAAPISVGESPLICANTEDNTGGLVPVGGTPVIRITHSSSTDISFLLSDWANEFPSNGAYAGVLTLYINESIMMYSHYWGTVTFDGSDKVGSYGTSGTLVVTEERDANAGNAATYPDNFYKQFKAEALMSSGYSGSFGAFYVGFNNIYFQHDDGTTTTETDKVGFVRDYIYQPGSTVRAPTLILNTALTELSGLYSSYRYMSGIKFYNTGSLLYIKYTIDDFTTLVYRDTTSPLTISSSNGTPIASQDFTYANLGLTPPLNKHLGTNGNNSPTTPHLAVNINGSGSGIDGIIKASAKNVNGTGPDLVDTTNIMYWITSPTLDESNLPNIITNGSAGQAGKRIKYAWTGTDYAYPAYTPGSNDWYTTYVWDSQTDTLPNTNEAGCYLDKIQHTLEDFSSSHSPVGDDLGSGRSSADIQYFTYAFKRNSISKFSIKITGEVTSLYIAFPQYNTDLTSTINGWLDCSTLYDGAGFPGANTSAGTPIGNGSNGVRRTGSPAQQGAFAVNIPLTNAYANLDLGEANTGLMTYPTVLVRFGVANDKSVTAISLEDWNPS
jgi:hypothetical protein